MRTLCLMVGFCVIGSHFSLVAAEPAVEGKQSAAASVLNPPVAKAVDLRPEFDRWNLERRRQGGRPTCSAFTVAGALEFAVARREGKGTRLSVEFLNWAANKACGDQEDGGFFSDLWKGYAAYGICAESDLPYQPKFDPAQTPGTGVLALAKAKLGLGLNLNWIKEWNVNTGLTGEHMAGIKRTLNAGWPVCGGFRWPKKEEWVADVLQMCPSNAVRDGHSVLLVGYRDDAAQPGGGVFIFRNTAGAGRDGLMSYTYAQAYMNDAVWVGTNSVAAAEAVRTNSRNLRRNRAKTGAGKE